MKRLLLGRVDLIGFVAMVFACGLAVRFGQNHACVLGLLPMPIILTAAVRGLREKFSPHTISGRSQVFSLDPHVASANTRGQSS